MKFGAKSVRPKHVRHPVICAVISGTFSSSTMSRMGSDLGRLVVGSISMLDLLSGVSQVDSTVS